MHGAKRRQADAQADRTSESGNRVKRRTFLKSLAGASAVAATAPVRVYGAAATRGETVVVGAGVFGAWAAWYLQRAGYAVRLLEAWAPAHSRASSGGESRLTRAEYGDDALYTRMAAESLPEWRWLSSRAGLPVFHPIGALYIFDETGPAVEASVELHREFGIQQQRFDAKTLAERYPQFAWKGNETGLFEPEFGVLMARRAVQVLVGEFVKNGGVYEQRAVLPPSARGNVLNEIGTSGGAKVRAERFVFACGPWLPKLFPDVVGRRVVPVRMEVFFFAPKAGDPRFDKAHLPGWVDRNGGEYFYGFPDLEGRGFKIARDVYGREVDPDTQDRRYDPAALNKIREFMKGRFPAMTSRPMTEARVCQYELTDNGDFIIDRHPRWQNVWLAGGGSGHGFKHGPAVGRYVTDLIAGRLETGEPRFALGVRQPHSS